MKKRKSLHKLINSGCFFRKKFGFGFVRVTASVMKFDFNAVWICPRGSVFVSRYHLRCGTVGRWCTVVILECAIGGGG